MHELQGESAGMTDEMEENDELLGMFVQEAVEHLETIEPDLLTLEENGSDTDPEIINRLFRGVHSIKGSAGFFGLVNITKLSHIMENLLGRVRDLSIVPDSRVTDSLLSGLDKLQNMINDVSNSEAIDASEEIVVIDEILNEEGGGSAIAKKPSASPGDDLEEVGAEAAEPQPMTDTSADMAGQEPSGVAFQLENFPDALSTAVQHGRKFFAVTLNLPEVSSEKKQYYLNMKELVESVGDLLDTDPSTKDAVQLDHLGSQLVLLVSTVLELDLIQTLISLPHEQILPIPLPEGAEAGSVPARAAAGTAKPGLATTAVKRTAAMGAKKAVVAAPADEAGGPGPKKGVPSMEETLRVSVSLLDELINNAGELVLARNQLTRASVQVASQFPHIAPLVQNLDSITSRIQEKVMQARMQPVSVVFNKFPRIIRDLARKLDKKIDLEIRGGDVELDKSVIEHLSDPLTHMIRNVADHAIEHPQDRLAIKKGEAGQVELAAYHENGMVNISLTDDGAGIDHERIKLKALEKNLITEHQADTMSDQDVLMLIFAPGFSMAKKVSDVSGRGVGMDVVRTNIEKLGGTVHIDSKVGKGTRIILKLPLTLAIIPAMIVSASDQRFAIPEVGLVEIVRVTESDRVSQIEMVGNAPVLRLRNNLLPLVDLAEVLTIPRIWPPGSEHPDRRRRLSDRRGDKRKARAAAALLPPKDSDDDRRDGDDRRDPHGLVAYVMVLNVGGNEFGMVVDEVLDSEEIVVKPLPAFFKDNPCFSATTILGDGSVALIIDYAGLMETARINFSNLERASRMDLDDERRAALREKQNIILLETDTGLIMGIVHSMVRRVEKISPALLETIGGLPYIRYDGKTFRAVYPDQVLGLEGMGFSGLGNGDSSEEGDGDLCMVVPNIPDLKAGLIFSRIIDTRETNIDLDTEAIRVSGLFGSAQIDDRVVLFPDVYSVFEMAGISSPHAGPAVDGAGLRALVVDDTPFLRVLTSSYLSGTGFVVDQAEDGHMAVQHLKVNHYDLLVTDLNMPAMDGFELAIEVPTTPNPEIPMIATTSSISSQLEQRCSRAGFVSCVPTIDKTKLLGVIASLQRNNGA
jgi:two-component system chemotaxis sensor kinase CheA